MDIHRGATIHDHDAAIRQGRDVMKTTVRDPDVLRSVRPLDVITYLQTSGWTLFQTMPERFTLWHRPAPEGDVFEALVPASAKLRDFAQRIAELLDTLEIAEGRSQAEILEDLLTPAADITSPADI